MPRIAYSHYAYYVRKRYIKEYMDNPIKARNMALSALLSFGFYMSESKRFLGIPKDEKIKREKFVL